MSDQEAEVKEKPNQIIENIFKFFKSKLGKVVIYTLIVFSIGFYFGTEYIKYQIKQAVNDVAKSFSNSFVSSNPRPENKAEQKINYIDVPQGQTANFKDFNLKILSSESLQSLTGKDNSFSSEKTVSARDGAKFILIEAEISNTGKDSLSLYESTFPLFDNKDRKYTPTQVYGVGLSGNYLTTQYTKPGFSEKGKLVFEVPTDSTEVSLQVAKKDTNDVYRFRLNI